MEVKGIKSSKCFPNDLKKLRGSNLEVKRAKSALDKLGLIGF